MTKNLGKINVTQRLINRIKDLAINYNEAKKFGVYDQTLENILNLYHKLVEDLKKLEAE